MPASRPPRLRTETFDPDSRHDNFRVFQQKMKDTVREGRIPAQDNACNQSQAGGVAKAIA
jgi:hypothetical protein